MGIGFILVAARLTALFLAMPIFSGATVSGQIRAAVIVVVSAAIYLSLPAPEHLPTDMLGLVLALLGELFVGFAAGFSARIVFSAVETAGQLLDMPMGLGFANAVDPVSNSTQTVTSRLLGIMVALMFLVMDVHLVLLRMVADSFLVLPPGEAFIVPEVGMSLVSQSALIFEGAVQLAAPVLLVLLATLAALGLLSKVAPQVNLFALSFAISIALGLVALRAALPDMTAWLRNVVGNIEPMALEAMSHFGA
jgi:flagellar biosynthetic protein FliR